MKIYFAKGLFGNVLQVIQESHDCLDVLNDLKAIQGTIQNGSDLDAIRLDDYLRKKYSIIDTMLNIANSIQICPCSGNSGGTLQSSYKSRLDQDRLTLSLQIARLITMPLTHTM